MYIQKGNESDIILSCHCEEQRGLRRGNLAERNAPDGWIPTVTSFPRNDKGGTPTPDCHVERSRNISWKGNDVNYRKIVCLVGAPSAQAVKQNTHSGRSYARYVQLQRRNTSRKAARKRTPSLTKKYKRLRRVVAKLAHKAQ